MSAGSPGPVREKQLLTASANMLALKRETPRSCAHTRSVKHAPHASALQSHDKAARHNANPNRAARSGDQTSHGPTTACRVPWRSWPALTRAQADVLRQLGAFLQILWGLTVCHARARLACTSRQSKQTLCFLVCACLFAGHPGISSAEAHHAQLGERRSPDVQVQVGQEFAAGCPRTLQVGTDAPRVQALASAFPEVKVAYCMSVPCRSGSDPDG